MKIKESYGSYKTTTHYELEKGENIDNPASTKTKIYGPGKVDITEYDDGGFDSEILEGCRIY